MLEDSEDTSIDLRMLPFLTKSLFEKVVAFCTYISRYASPNIKRPINLKHKHLTDFTTPWYADFADQMSDEELCSMLYAANYLD